MYPQAKPERNQYVYEQWQLKRNISDIGKELGITRERVRQILNKLGVATTRHPFEERLPTCKVCNKEYRRANYKEHCEQVGHPFSTTSRFRHSEPRTLLMAYEYAMGGNAKEIAERYGVTRIAVYANHTRIFGPKRPLGMRSPQRIAAAKMIDAGEPLWKITKETGISPTQIHGMRRYHAKIKE